MKRKHLRLKGAEDFNPSKEEDSKSKKESKFKKKHESGQKPYKKDNFYTKKKNYFTGDKKTNPYPKKKKGFASRMKMAGHLKSGNTPGIPVVKQTGDDLIRLNKYLSNAGICSRREADAYIASGVVKVNGQIITQLGYKISPGDKVQFGDDSVHKEKSVYILLNKPKGYITTCDDPQERDTVMDLIQNVQERVYPVGRLDRNTTGLLLLTNDGDLAKTLMHPKYNVVKIYNAILDKDITLEHIEKIRKGINLEDGFIKVDAIEYVDGSESRNEIGIEIHSGRNRIIRRVFESLGYRVDKLDRVLYASLTKKNLPRGKWRFLEENEVRMLKRIK